jgi:hypothetical protein
VPASSQHLSRLRLLSDGDLRKESLKAQARAKSASADRFQIEWLRIARYLQSPSRWPTARYLEVNTADGLDFIPILTVLDAHGQSLIPDELAWQVAFNERFATVLLDFQKTLLSSFGDFGGGETFPYLDLAQAQPITPQAYQRQVAAASLPSL